MTKNLERHINKFLRAYLDTNEEFEYLDDTEKLHIYSILRKLLSLIHQVIKHRNVYPILVVHNYKSKQIISKAFAEIEHVLPTINNIKIEVAN